MTEPAHSNQGDAARQAVRTDALLGIDLVLVGEGLSEAPSIEHFANEGDAPKQLNAAPAPVNTTGEAPAIKKGSTPVVPVSIDESYFNTDSSKESRLDRLREHHVSSCVYCRENDSDHLVVFGEGNPDASLMFVGEAPGTEEERLGRPFAGRAGSKLDEMIKAMGLRREDVYITNALKSRPPGTHASQSDDFESCGAFFSAQVRIIKPKVIVALGGPAAKLVLRSDLGITSLRGRWGSYFDGQKDVALMPTFHPAYLLRNPTLEVRGQVWADLQEVMKRLGLVAPSRD